MDLIPMQTPHSIRDQRWPLLQPRCSLLIFLMWAAASAPSIAHDDNSVEIQKLTAKITASAGDAQLFLRRAEMHRLSRHWHAALADYRQAAKLDPELALVDLALATMWTDFGKPRVAIPLLDRYLLRCPTSSGGYAERARAKRMLKQWAAAAADSAEVFKHTPEPDPEVFAEWAAILIDGGDQVQALDVLNQGISSLGRVVSLDMKALELEESMALYGAALRRVDGMLAAPGRKDSLMLRKSTILVAAGRKDEARDCVALARREFTNLAESRRLTAAGQQIAGEIERLEVELAKTTTPESKKHALE
jgi:tetratricopeptide (TPR) repeat protein